MKSPKRVSEVTDLKKSKVPCGGRSTRMQRLVESLIGEQNRLRRTIEDQSDQLEILSEALGLLIARSGGEVREPSDQLGAKLAYARMLRRIRDVLAANVPPGAKMLVISKGDDKMLELDGVEGRHFPQNLNGAYAGYYPANDMAAIAHLEALRAKGAEFLLIPKTAFWWLERYSEWSRHLEQSGSLLARDEEACALYSLQERLPAKAETMWDRLDEVVTQFESIFGRRPTMLDCHTDLQLAKRFPQHVVFEPPTADDTLPYLDKTVDFVALITGNEGLHAEARRVASYAVALFAPGVASEPSIEIHGRVSCAEMSGRTSIIIPTLDSHTLSEDWLLTLRNSLPPDFSGEVTLLHRSKAPTRLRRLNGGKGWLKVMDYEGAATVELLNHAGRAASGDTLVFLEPGSLLFRGWLPVALRTFRDWPNAGAVAAKVLSSDGRLKEAGRHVLADGSIIGIGEGAYDCDAPEFNFVSEVPCCSSPVLITRRAIFTEIGGFDIQFSNNQYSFADYSMKLYEKKLAVYYQPKLTAVQVSDGEDDAAQSETRSLFLERWGHRIQRSCIPASCSSES